MVTEGCSESRMRSRTSRGVPERSGGEDRYIGRRVLESGSVPGVPGYGQHDRKVFRGPRQVLHGLMSQGEGENQPTKGWCAPHTLSHVTWGGGAPPPGLGGKPPPAWLGGQVSLGFSLGRSNLLGRRPLGETLGRLPLSPCPYI